MHSFKVPIPLGNVAFSSEEAYKKAKQMSPEYVVKAQVLGGGRGLGYFKENQF